MINGLQHEQCWAWERAERSAELDEKCFLLVFKEFISTEMGWCKIYWNSSLVDSSSFLNFFFYRARITETGGVGVVGRLEVEYAILDFH